MDVFLNDLFQLYGALWLISTLIMVPSLMLSLNCGSNEETFFKWLSFVSFAIFLSVVPYGLYLRYWGK
jgi:hypothetical protein